MQNLKTVRNAFNMTIGTLQEYSDRIVATHYRKGYAGYYSKGSDTTFDRSGRIYCRGDGTSDLIRELEREG